MPKYQIQIEVFPKAGMPDPASSGEARKLDMLFPDSGVQELKIGKLIGFIVESVDEAEATDQTHLMAAKLLVQPVLEDYRIHSLEPYEASTD